MQFSSRDMKKQNENKSCLSFSRVWKKWDLSKKDEEKKSFLKENQQKNDEWIMTNFQEMNHELKKKEAGQLQFYERPSNFHSFEFRWKFATISTISLMLKLVENENVIHSLSALKCNNY